jgi:peptidoglycan/xylan/chitin deacetylase (PgdA/CDA1 family)
MLVPTDRLTFTFANKTLALTFDDGPGPRTVEIAEFLHNSYIPATFFVLGRHVRERREVLGKVKQLGHLIGNHTDTHRNLRELASSSPDQLIKEVMTNHREIKEYLGDGPAFLRAPGGDWSAKAAEILNQNNELQKYLGPVNWDFDGGDYEIGSTRNRNPQNPPHTLETCGREYLQKIREKGFGIVLLHDWSADPGEEGDRLRRNNQTYDLVKWLVPQLSDYKFVTLADVPFVLN